MIEKPILFSTDMVKAVLDGRKTVTRRVIIPQPEVFNNAGFPDYSCLKLRYQKGDLLWVRETWAYRYTIPIHNDYRDAVFKASKEAVTVAKWKPSIFMFKKFARIWLEVLDVRAESLQEISLEECYAEGIESQFSANYKNKENIPIMPLKKRFKRLWDSLNAKRGYPWESNPWVWRCEFKRSKNTRNK